MAQWDYPVGLSQALAFPPSEMALPVFRPPPWFGASEFQLPFVTQVSHSIQPLASTSPATLPASLFSHPSPCGDARMQGPSPEFPKQVPGKA